MISQSPHISHLYNFDIYMSFHSRSKAGKNMKKVTVSEFDYISLHADFNDCFGDVYSWYFIAMPYIFVTANFNKNDIIYICCF